VHSAFDGQICFVCRVFVRGCYVGDKGCQERKMQGETVACVRVLYNFDYTTKDGRLVSIRQAEKLHLLKRTNPDWWQVRYILTHFQKLSMFCKKF
jgi:hypothetical protein